MLFILLLKYCFFLLECRIEIQIKHLPSLFIFFNLKAASCNSFEVYVKIGRDVVIVPPLIKP